MTHTTYQKEIDWFILEGIKAGCPVEQVEGLISKGYFPYPWQWQFHATARQADETGGPVDIGLGGARGPGKSHSVLSQVALDDCQRVAGLKCLFLRQTGMSAKESFDDLITKTVKGRVKYQKTITSLKFPNGSSILLGGFKDEGDIDKYIGIEYDIIIVEELNQLTEEKYKKLRGSLRTSKPNWRPRMYTSFNPGGVGHSFVRSRYVIPYREGKEKETRFIPSTYKSNPALNQEYIEYLEGLGGNLGKAWREGEFDVFDGQYFGEWRYERHTQRPFTVPASWPRYRSIDPSGQAGYTACGWYALDSDGRVHKYREYVATGKDSKDHAIEITRLSTDESGVLEDYKYTVIDSAAFSKQGYSETTAEIYERHGVVGLIPAAKDRVPGWTLVHQYLKLPKSESEKPLLCIFSTCVKMIAQIPLAQHDELHPEDVSSKYVKTEEGGMEHNDALDELRYFLRTLREQKAAKPLSKVEARLKQLREQENQNNFNYSRKPQ